MLRTFQIKRNVGKRRLETNPSWHIDVKDEFLQRLVDLVLAQLISANERRQERVKIRERLSASRFALQSVKEIDHLPKS